MTDRVRRFGVALALALAAGAAAQTLVQGGFHPVAGAAANPGSGSFSGAMQAVPGGAASGPGASLLAGAAVAVEETRLAGAAQTTGAPGAPGAVPAGGGGGGGCGAGGGRWGGGLLWLVTAVFLWARRRARSGAGVAPGQAGSRPQAAPERGGRQPTFAPGRAAVARGASSFSGQAIRFFSRSKFLLGKDPA